MSKTAALKAHAVAADRVDLSWEAPAEAHEHRVYRSLAPRPPAAGDNDWIAAVREPRLADRHLEAGRRYHYLVESLDAHGRIAQRCRTETETPPAGLRLERAGSRLTVRGDAFTVAWDMAHGGEIVEIRQYDGDSWLRLNSDAPPTVPGMVVRGVRGGTFPVRNYRARRVVVERCEREEMRFSFEVALPGLTIGFRYILFREGVLFCELTMPQRRLSRGRTQGVAAERAMTTLDGYTFEMGLRVNPALLRTRAAWGYKTRDYGETRVGLAATAQARDARRLFAMGMLDYGVNPDGGFTNHAEFFIEDSPPEGAASRFGGDGRGGFAFEWRFTGKSLRKMFFLPWDMGFFRTRWGLCLGASRKGPSGRVPFSRQDSLIGARILHTGPGQGVPPDARRRWPYNVPPADLIERQYAGLPSNAHVRDAARQGANVIVVHQGWMRSGGSNCEPPADYIPRNPRDLRRFVAACRRHGIRVGLYMRGVEKHAFFQPYFEEFLRRDIDGLYVDWNSPFTLGQQNCSPLHFSALACYLFVRALRERVGDGGFLISHSGMSPTMLAFAPFDAYLPGEWRTQKQEFHASPERALLHGFASCIATNPIYSRTFATPRAAAFNAGLGFHPHVGLPCGAPLNRRHHMAGVWKILSAAPVERATLYNNLNENFRASVPSRRSLHTTTYRISRDQVLLLTANLGPRGGGEIRLNMAGLGLTGSYAVTELRAQPGGPLVRRARGVTSDGVIRLPTLDRYAYIGHRLQRLPARRGARRPCIMPAV